MKRAASPLTEVVAQAESDVITEIVTEIPMHNIKRQKTEEEVCLDDGYDISL